MKGKGEQREEYDWFCIRLHNIVLGLGFLHASPRQSKRGYSKPRFPITECHGNLAKNENNYMLIFHW